MFRIDINGLRKQISNIPKVLVEPIQNAWDENSTTVTIHIEKRGHFVYLKVVDDNPEGFKDLSHAYTLFAESHKKDDPTKRGRFNIGEKMVISVAQEATITTTKGQIKFYPKENKKIITRKKTDKGSIFEAKIKMSQNEYNETLSLFSELIPPKNIKTLLNNKILPSKSPIKIFQATLETIQGEYFSKTKRKCDVEIYTPDISEEPHLYEMGIPVVAIEGRWHINIMQKVPLNRERDNVTPAYRKAITVEVVNNITELLTADDATSSFVKPAIAHSGTSREALAVITNHLFDKDWVSYDMNDTEANSSATHKGITVVKGAQLNRYEWANLKDKGLVTTAGHAFPTPTPYSKDNSAEIEKILPEEEWTEGMYIIANFSKSLAQRLLGIDITVKMTLAGSNFLACYGEKEITFNIAVLKKNWFDNGINEEVVELILHELAHEYEANHLSENYTRSVCKIAAKFFIFTSGNQTLR